MSLVCVCVCAFDGLTRIVEGLYSIQVLVDFVLDAVQLGARHAGVDEGLGGLLKRTSHGP